MTQGTRGGRRGRRITRTGGLTTAGHHGWSLGFVAAVLLGLSGVGSGAPGDLDPTFGAGGVAITFGPQDSANALVLQPDGKLVVAGSSAGDGVNHILLARYLPDGRPDPAFGTGGVVVTDVSVPVFPRALIQQPDGKLVLVGYHAASGSSDILLARYRPDGRLDPAFGTGGLVITDVGGRELPSAVLQQPDGTLVVAGGFSMGGANDIVLARYQALGCPAVDPDPCLASLAAFVTEVYQAALARQPDAGEAGYWVDVLTSEPTPDTVRGMLHVVFDGPEFRQRPVTPWQYVDVLYQALLGREPNPGELD